MINKQHFQLICLKTQQQEIRMPDNKEASNQRHKFMMLESLLINILSKNMNIMSHKPQMEQLSRPMDLKDHMVNSTLPVEHLLQISGHNMNQP